MTDLQMAKYLSGVRIRCRALPSAGKEDSDQTRSETVFGARIRSKIFLVAIGIRFVISVSFLLPAVAQMPTGLKTAIDKRCSGCHSGVGARGGLDFASLSFDLSNRLTRDRWGRIHDRIERGERPAKGREPSRGGWKRMVAPTRAVAIRGGSCRRGEDRPRADAARES